MSTNPISEELLPCPFCGAHPHHGLTKVEHDQLHGEPFQRFRVWCPHGCASKLEANRELAVAVWNRRAADSRANQAVVTEEMVEAALSAAASDVLAERARQIAVEGWTPEHDDSHDHGEMARAAMAYAYGAPEYRRLGGGLRKPGSLPSGFVWRIWPWAQEWWKPSDDRRNLVKAGALILAEIERLDRFAGRATPEVALSRAAAPVVTEEIHPLASWPEGLALGLHRVFWKSGGSSLCAVGMQSNGKRWLAPCNWVAPTLNAGAGEWAEIERTEVLFPYPEDTAALSRAEGQEPVAVKPLEWEHLGHDNWRALSPLFGYIRIDDYGNGCTVNWSIPGVTGQLMPGKWASSDDAKAAAQAHFDQAIISVVVKAPAPAVPDGWKPIETAPKDGTSLLLAHEDAAFDGWWSEFDGAWIDGSTNSYDEPRHFEPTHWRELPAPPISPSQPLVRGEGE